MFSSTLARIIAEAQRIHRHNFFVEMKAGCRSGAFPKE